MASAISGILQVGVCLGHAALSGVVVGVSGGSVVFVYQMWTRDEASEAARAAKPASVASGNRERSERAWLDP